MQYKSTNPAISRLLPLQTAWERLGPTLLLAPAEAYPLGQATGKVLASDVRPVATLPSHPIALTDGWAVRAEDLVGSSAYGPAVLTPAPPWVDAGTPMPPLTDAVLPPEAVSLVSPDTAEAAAAIVPGEGVRLSGQDIAAGALVLRKGTRLEPYHIGILRACGLNEVPVHNPRVLIVIASRAAAPHAEMVRAWIEGAGARVTAILSEFDDPDALANLYRALGADLLVSLGGTGRGRNDCAVASLSRAGSVAVHGIALRPGETSAIGRVGAVPALLLPGRLDSLVAGMLTLALPALARLSGSRKEDRPIARELLAKASSAVGLDELFLGVPDGDAIRPIPLAEARLDAMAQAVGWFVVPPESEGLAAGQIVHVLPFHLGHAR